MLGNPYTFSIAYPEQSQFDMVVEMLVGLLNNIARIPITFVAMAAHALIHLVGPH